MASTTTREPVPASATLLLVESEAPVAGFLEDLLTQAGYEVTVVRDAAAALVRVESEPFEVVLVSGEIAGKNCAAIAAHARVIVLSGYGKREVGVEVMCNGAAEYLLMPLSGPDDLLRRLVEVRSAPPIAPLRINLDELPTAIDDALDALRLANCG